MKKKKRRKGKKSIYIYILFKQREDVFLFFHLGEVRKNRDGGVERLTPRLGCCTLPPTVKSLVLTIVSCNVCDFLRRKKITLFKILKVLLFLLPQALEKLF